MDARRHDGVAACKSSLARETLLAHARIELLLALYTDASDTMMGAALQQETTEGWQLLPFFSRKLSPTQAKYSTFDRQLLAIYQGMKQFKHMLESRTFAIYTDHKPLVYAFNKSRTNDRPDSSATWTS